MGKKTIKDTESDEGNPRKTSKAAAAVTPEIEAEISQVRDTILSRIGQVTLSFMGVPRYAHQSIGDLQALCLAPLMRERIAIATTQPRNAVSATAEGEDSYSAMSPLVGLAIWANVSNAVDKKIKEQITAGIFPVKLAAEDWTSGDNIWLLDVIAPNQKLSARVVGNFSQVLKTKLPDGHSGQMNLHPIIKKMLGDEVLAKMGAVPQPVNSPSAKPISEASKNSGVTKPGKKDTRILN